MRRAPKLPVLGLSLAATLVTCGTLTSNALAGAQWTIGGSSLSQLGIEKESFTATGKLTLEVPTFGVKITCESVEVTGQIIGTKKSEAILKLSSCMALDSKGKKIASCPIAKPLSLTAEGEFIESEKESVYDILKPKAGESFGTIVFEGKECPLGEKVSIKGSTAAEIGLGEWPERTLTFSQSIAEKAKTTLKYGASTAYFNGSVLATLSGAHAKGEWGVRRKETLLCGVEYDPCPGTTTYPAGTKFSGSLKAGSEARFEGSFGTVQCTNATFEGEISKEKAEQLPGTISALGFSSCNLGKTACTLTTEHLPYSPALTATSGADGVLSLSTKETPTVAVKCGELSCTLSGNLELAFEGGAPATVEASKASFASPKEGTCAKTSLSATYTLQKPEEGSAFVAQGQPPPTKLCLGSYVFNQQTVKLKCTGEPYLGEIITGELQAGTFAKVWEVAGAPPPKEVVCNESSFEGRFAENGDPGAVLGGMNILTFTSAVGGVPGQPCASANIMMGNPPVTVTFPSLPERGAYLRYLRPGGEQGGFFVVPWSAGFIVKLVIAGMPVETCNYEALDEVPAWFNGVGGNPSKLRIVFRLIRLLTSGPVCPAGFVHLETNLNVTGSGGFTNVYVTGE